MTEKEFKDWLEKKGFKFRHNVASNTEWYAWKPMKGWRHCVCNEKSPSINIEYHAIPIADKMHIHIIVQMVAAIGKREEWVTINFYALSVDDVVKNLDRYIRSIGRAWEAMG